MIKLSSAGTGETLADIWKWWDEIFYKPPVEIRKSAEEIGTPLPHPHPDRDYIISDHLTLSQNRFRNPYQWHYPQRAGSIVDKISATVCRLPCAPPRGWPVNHVVAEEILVCSTPGEVSFSPSMLARTAETSILTGVSDMTCVVRFSSTFLCGVQW